jgi:hypothetical protein
MEVDDGHSSHVDRRRVLSNFDFSSESACDLGASSQDKGKGRAVDSDFDVRSFTSASTSRLLPDNDLMETASLVMSEEATIFQSQSEYNADADSDGDDRLHSTMVLRLKDKDKEVASSSNHVEPNTPERQVSNSEGSAHISDDDDDFAFCDVENEDWDIEHDFFGVSSDDETALSD